MLRLPSFRLRTASSLAEAAAILDGEGPAARLVAGGTDLWPNLKRRHQHARTVVSLVSLPELRGISLDGKILRIGATARLADVAAHPVVRERYPALAKAIESISSPPLRNMGTLGGNLCIDTRCTYYNQTEHWRRAVDYCLKEAGEVCWVAPSSSKCWAHSASDGAPILSVLGATVRLVSTIGERELPIAELFQNDGIEPLTKRSDEVLTEIRIPAASAAPRCRAAFWKLRRRGAIDFAVLSTAAALEIADNGEIRQARLTLGAVASRPLTIQTDTLHGHRLGTPELEVAISEAAHGARQAATPMDNTDFQTQWRGRMVETYTTAALRDAAGLDPQLTQRR